MQTSPTAESEDSQPKAPEASEFQRLACYSQLGLDIQVEAIAIVQALFDWHRGLDPLMDQFRYTPWAEIPDAVKPAVESQWRQMFNEALAKQAIQLGVPVSSMVCTPEAPDCAEFTPEKVEGVYLIVVQDARIKVSNATQELASGNDAVRIAMGSGLDYALLQEVGRQGQRIAGVYQAVSAFYQGLPATAVVPAVVWPPHPKPPGECRGVLKLDE